MIEPLPWTEPLAWASGCIALFFCLAWIIVTAIKGVNGYYSNPKGK